VDLDSLGKALPSYIIVLPGIVKAQKDGAMSLERLGSSPDKPKRGLSRICLNSFRHYLSHPSF
jgi:hypothetical protein